MIINKKYCAFILFSCIAVILLGIYVLILDRIFQLQIATPHQLGQLPLATDAAFCFILIGFAVIFRLYTKRIIFKFVQILCLAAVLATATLALLYKLGIANFIDMYFGMSPQTAICFLFLGIAFLGIRFNNKIYRSIIQFLLNLVTFISFIVIIGHLFGVPQLHQFAYFPSMAVYTAIGFCLLSISIALINPNIGLISIFTGKRIGNVMARRIFWEMLISVLIIGYIHILDHRYNWFHEEVGSALLTILLALAGLLVIWETSSALNHSAEKLRFIKKNFKLAFYSAPYALVLADRQGKIMMVNHHTEHLYGYTRHELVGQDVKMVIPPKMHASYEINKDRFFEKGQIIRMVDSDEEEVLALNKNGREFPIELILTPVQTENGLVSMASIIDITERKTFEKIIKSQVAELQMKNLELEQFNYIASHDLQEPLRTVTNYINLLEEDYPEQINEEIRQHLGVMDAAVSRMSMLVRSLLDFGRLGRNRKLILTDTATLVEHVIADLDNLIKTSGAIIIVETEMPVLYAYETELRLLFQNLMSNAVKFRKQGIAPEVRIGCKKADGYYRFYVKDNGIGIDPAYKERIFHIFQRLHKEEEFEGHGIGLANCRKIADMHGGKIWVKSRKDTGSTFKFTIMNLTP